jgi:spermidine/putrescine transport system substrate-binding protein
VSDQTRRALRRIAIAGAALAASLGIAACGGDDVGGGSDEEVQVAESGPVEGKLTISNWPGYIDQGPNGSVAEFEERYGVDVEYKEDVNDNVQFFGKVRPLLDEGQSGDRDIMVVTDWMANQMYDLGYLQEIDHADIPTVTENLKPQFETSSVDPERKFSIPWQGGMTGVWVNTEEAPDIESVNDLFDPQYKGRVTMLTEMRDTVPLVMKADGIEPEDATKEDWLAAIDKIKDAADSGQIRRFTGNDYTEDLTAGNAVASIGWSGDGYLIGRPNVEWRMPSEGCVYWFDNMVIPVGAPNTAAALEWMNFAYEPKVQADIAAFVNYVTPVDGVQEIFEKTEPKLAQSDLIFPDDAFLSSCDAQPEPPGDAEEVDEVTQAFQDVVAG